MIRNFCFRIFFAVALVCSPSAVLAQSAASDGTSKPSLTLTTWLERTITLLNEASATTTAFADGARILSTGGDRASLLASLRTTRAAARSAHATLGRIQGDLKALGPYTSTDQEAVLREATRALWTDSNKYVQDIDALLLKTVAFVDAVERNDPATVARLAPELRQGGVLLLDGQILAIRGRQRLFDSSDSTFHSLGAYASFYEAMKALLTGSVGANGDALRITARATAAWAVSGRAALSAERATLKDYRAEDRGFMTEVFDAEERGFVVIDQMVATINAAADETGAAYDASALRHKYLPELSRLEVSFQQVADEQAAITSRAAQR